MIKFLRNIFNKKSEQPEEFLEEISYYAAKSAFNYFFEERIFSGFKDILLDRERYKDNFSREEVVRYTIYFSGLRLCLDFRPSYFLSVTNFVRAELSIELYINNILVDGIVSKNGVIVKYEWMEKIYYIIKDMIDFHNIKLAEAQLEKDRKLEKFIVSMSEILLSKESKND